MSKLLITSVSLILFLIPPQYKISHLFTSLADQDSNFVEAYPNGIPVKIDTISLLNRATTKVMVRLTNLSDDNVTDVQMLLVVDKPGIANRIEYKEIGVDLTAHGGAESTFYLDKKLPPGSKLVVTITKAIGNSGIWSVDANKLVTAIRETSDSNKQMSESAHYEANVELSNQDKIEIISTVLKSILQSRSLKGIISFEPTPNLIVSTENYDSELPAKILGYKLIPMNIGQIQNEAKQKGKISYFTFYPLTIEGARVRVNLEYSELLGKGGGNNLHTSCCGGLIFEFYKENGKWIGKHIGNERT